MFDSNAPQHTDQDQSQPEAPTVSAPPYPSVRYFQIHFEYLQEQLQLILRNQDALQQRVQALEVQLQRLDKSRQSVPSSSNALQRNAAAVGNGEQNRK